MPSGVLAGGHLGSCLAFCLESQNLSFLDVVTRMSNSNDVSHGLTDCSSLFIHRHLI